MQVLINPNHTWGNEPDVCIVGARPNTMGSNRIYHKGEDGCYWFQNPETGETDFLYNSSPLKEVSLGKWETTQHTEGFGGRSFHLVVQDKGSVHLKGAWSGGCYLANKVLPKPATEVSYVGYSIAGYLTLEVVNKALEQQGSKWRVIETTGPHAEQTDYWVAAVYDGQRKRDMSDELLARLQKEYDDALLSRNHGPVFTQYHPERPVICPNDRKS